MAKEHRKCQIGPALMIDSGKAAMGDDIERLLAAVIGMGAPADVGEKTRGVAEPALFGGFIQAGRSYEAVGPGDQFLAMTRRARAQLVEMAGSLDQRILFFFLVLE